MKAEKTFGDEVNEGAVPAKLFDVKALAPNVPVAFCMIDTQLRYVQVNQLLADINGAPIKQHIGKTPWDIVPSFGDQAEMMMSRVLNTGEPLMNIEFCGETPAKPGETRIFLENWDPVRDKEGQIIGANITVFETTEHIKAQMKRQEKGLYQKDEQIKQMRNKNGVLRVIADMMNDSLSIVRSTLNLLENNPGDEKLLKHGIKTAKWEQNRAEYYAERISELVAVKKVPVKKERIDLYALLRQAAGAYTDRLRQANIDFQSDIPEKPYYLDADPAQLNKILQNMLHLSLTLLLPGEKVFLIVMEDKMKSEVSMIIQLFNIHHQIKIIPMITAKNFPELKFDMMKAIMESHGGRFDIKEEDIGINPLYIFRFPIKNGKRMKPCTTIQ
jgi:PAS domain S-box-containing protein